MLTLASCCLGSRQFIAVRAGAEEAYARDICPDGQGFCPGDLAICVPHTTHVASCVAGRCEAIDLESLRGCRSDGDCALAAARCCGDGVMCDRSTTRVAISAARSDELESLVCGDRPADCRPDDGAGVCESGRCELRRLSP